MSKYRIRESRGVYYPEKRFLGIFWEPLGKEYNSFTGELSTQGYFNIECAQKAIDCHYQEEHQQKNKFHHYDPTENQ
jgi:hypothetical protein